MTCNSNEEFSFCYDFMLKLEGGYILHRNIGESTNTYAGIYRKYHPDWIGWHFLDKGEKPPSEVVKGFYKEQIWDKIKGDKLPKGLSLTMFDFAVNSDYLDAAKVLQGVLKVSQDGIIGTKTLNMLQHKLDNDQYNIKIESLIREVNAQRLVHMMSLPKYLLDNFKVGWSRRVCKVLTESLKIS